MKKVLVASVVLAIVAAACSVSGEINIGGSGPVENQVEDFIEGDFGDGFGLGELDASCTKPSSEDVGTTFLCTATTASGDIVRLETTLSEDDAFDVQTTNLILGGSWGPIEGEMVRILSENTTPDVVITVDCGTETVVFDIGVSEPHICAAGDGSGSIFDLSIAFTSLVPGNILWDWEIGDVRP
jgi:hypothetical protein